ncbi:translation initiation factor IF-2 [Synechococcus sp. HB1133]|uniref:translation initiation factor IF-2 n=3 Tax=Synechococcus TaxID=1129 RepID=UPI00140ACBF4|nr:MULTISPECIES: translation initiation factor IF-2 [unclassified Synechococcus]MCB4423383.1 translation initiation factor IF-2 [Synechococcus sp. HB1133]MCB4431506.1 translation initiation factor IF-2 [Synechococcus sp. HBA1120]NHI82331.1 translation initiation factor IF-2 [Synechococcus sp. HB1133]
MTSSGKVRIYELSKDLGLENKDVLDAAEKLSIAAKSHSSSISDAEAGKIRSLLVKGGNGAKPTAAAPAKPAPGKAILSVKKAAPAAPSKPTPAVSKPVAAKPQVAPTPQAPPKPPAASTPKPIISKPTPAPAKASAPPARPAAPQKPPSAPARPTASKPVPRPAGSPAPRAASKPQPVNKPPAAKPELVSKPKAAAKPTAPTPARPTPRPAGAGTPGRPTPGQGQQKPQIIRAGAPTRPGAPTRAGAPSKPGAPARPTPKPELVGKPVPRRPAGTGVPQRQGGPSRPGAPTRQSRPGMPPRTGNTLELVGKPIRRDGSTTGSGRPGAPTRPGAPGRPGMPAGMRKPVAPGELMQLQKPVGRPTAPAPRRPDAPTKASAGAATPPVARPTAPSAPRRPSFRPGGPGGQRRPGRPDWDDSAKLEALRSRSPQKQRQKVHIIGENDDSLAAQTGGFAGEQENMVLSASLARPSKPKLQQRTAPKPMAAMRKRKKETARQRQRRRAMELRAAREAKQVRPEMIVVPEDNLTVQELADMLSVESSEIIKSLFFKGVIATVTQTLDMPTIEAVAEEFGVPVLQDDVEEAAKKTVEMIEEADKAHLIRRPPVVTVMGHVDHGKTSLLDAIRQARVAAGEAGGITQHIGAYQVEVEHNNEPRKLTFLDTPGHAAFTAMRARGTKVTDVAVLVVAADDGVRPQTLEAISHARAAEVPIVVAINKIDKEGSSPERVKQELSEQNLLAEDWGGDVVMVPVSAIKGENIDKLLEMLLLVTEVEDLQANPDRLARGTVIEAHLDKAKGPVATLLVQNGTLKTGDVVAAGPVLGKVRAMVDDNRQRLKSAGPSFAVEALGFSEVPTAGDEFEVYPDEKSARAVVGDRASDARATRLAQQMASRRVSLTAMSGQANDGELKELNLILKADVQGSVEAILGSLEQLPKDEVQVRVLLSAPGEITETDVDLAAASGAVIVGFNTSMASGAKKAADATGVDVRDYDVIYKLLEDIQMAMEGLLEPELVEEALGEAEVRAVFTIGKSAVAGCYVNTGKLHRNCRVRVHRGKQVVYEGDLDSLRRNKDDVKEVATGFECGVGTDRFANWEEGDRIEAFKMVTQRRKLTT